MPSDRPRNADNDTGPSVGAIEESADVRQALREMGVKNVSLGRPERTRRSLLSLGLIAVFSVGMVFLHVASRDDLISIAPGHDFLVERLLLGAAILGA